MAITVNTNVFSLAAQKNLNRTQSDLQSSVQRLSSGLRINMAKDDAAGLAIAQLQTAQARGLTVAQRNIADGTSFLSVADATLQSVSDMMQ
ncbi:MAG: flagellin FliC, partial [Candidatus Thiodiazotropha sp. (ex Ctena orbiculata)]|nr:flagellin FliC [Candidatus Thiodiazotropha taylori]